MGRKHKEILQLDGAVEIEKDTDCWWENNYTNCIKIFQTYKDVLEEINESSLSEEEKSIELESHGGTEEGLRPQLYLLPTMQHILIGA